jgi:hypothetical protein
MKYTGYVIIFNETDTHNECIPSNAIIHLHNSPYILMEDLTIHFNTF